MTCRLHRVVASLLALAAGTQAGESVTLKSPRFVQNATVAEDELLVDTPGPVQRPMRQALAGGATGRAALQESARTILARGNSRRASAVLYLDGRVGDPAFRAYDTRRVFIEVVPGQDAARLAAEHGLRLVSNAANRPGWWIAEPISPDVLAALDAARSLAGDARASIVWPLLELPVSLRYDPNDPIYQAGYQWHLSDAFPGIRVRQVWNTWKGEGTNLAITDGGTQMDHPDLAPNIKVPSCFNYFHNIASANPTTADDNHGTVVAGLAAARGDNLLGVTGVAFQAGLVASKVLNDYDPNAINADSAAPDDRLRLAMIAEYQSTNPADLIWANNNSWGVPDSGTITGGPGPLMLSGINDGVFVGRNSKGIVYVWACGNGGWLNPNALTGGKQDCTAFDGYLNRFVLGVAALRRADGGKAYYSESGPNITISAPGGSDLQPNGAPYPRREDYPRPISALQGICSTDRTGAAGYITSAHPQGQRPVSDFNDDDIVVATTYTQSITAPLYPPPATPPAALPYENGDYVPPQELMQGTSFAAPIVTGCVNLMLQARPDLSWRDVRMLMMHRGQDATQPPPFAPPPAAPPKPHDDWGFWRNNAVLLQYNNWYGFGAVDMGRFVFGGNGAEGDQATVAGRNEPGALRWPLLPPLTTTPASYSGTFPIVSSIINPDGDTWVDTSATPAVIYNRDAYDPYAIRDAPPPIPGEGDINLVREGLTVELDGFNRHTSIIMPVTGAPDRFRVDAVEMTVTLEPVGGVTYQGLGIIPDSREVGYNGSFNYGDYLFSLYSPNGTRAILGRQRPGAVVTSDSTNPGGTWTWTFTELFHTNEIGVNGNWIFDVIDEVHTPANPQNRPQCRIKDLAIKVYGHQTYNTPTLSGVTLSGLDQGVASGTGDQSVELTGAEFGFSQGRVGVAKAYWDADGAGNPSVPVELPTTVNATGRVRVTIPAALLPTASPGQGYVTVANPAVVIGRTAAGNGGIDAFDTPHVYMPSEAATAGAALASDTPMKRCPVGEQKPIKYSRRPTLTPIADVRLPTSGGAVSATTNADDADVAANLPAGTPETLSITVTSTNPAFFSPAVAGPGGNGIGTWAITGTVGGNSGFALVEVKVTDGVLTTTRAFRVVVPSEEDGSGCGGGMGLALIGVPLAALFIRRRRRGG